MLSKIFKCIPTFGQYFEITRRTPQGELIIVSELRIREIIFYKVLVTIVIISVVDTLYFVRKIRPITLGLFFCLQNTIIA